MSYYFSKTLSTGFDETLQLVADALKREGFGILTDIDVKDTLKKKLDVDFPGYRILGACNPGLAYEALKQENKIGTMLPCNVVVREADNGEVEVAAIDPVASMAAVENPGLKRTAEQVREKLRRLVANLQPAHAA